MNTHDCNTMVALDNVTKILGGVKRIDQLTMHGTQGHIYGLIGPNGSGKTTLLNLITGLYRPDEGHVRINGLDPIKSRKEVRRLIGLLPQHTALYPELTAHENLSFHAALYLPNLKQADARIGEILALIGLSDRQREPVKNFSGGMSRRLGIGRALLNDPKVLLLDEPTLGVDVQSAHKIWEYIRHLKDHNKTIFITTNVMAEADALCDEVFIIDRGQLVCAGTPQQLKTDLGAGTIRMVPKDKHGLSEDALRRRIGPFSYDGTAIIIDAPHGERDLADALSQLHDLVALESIALHTPTLDDVFLAHTGKALRN